MSTWEELEHFKKGFYKEIFHRTVVSSLIVKCMIDPWGLCVLTLALLCATACLFSLLFACYLNHIYANLSEAVMNICRDTPVGNKYFQKILDEHLLSRRK